MAPSTSLLSLLALLTPLASATLCPALDNAGHGPNGQWTLSNLDWKRTRKMPNNAPWPPSESQMDEAEVTFKIASPFNDAGDITCTARAVEFSEEYDRQLAGQPANFHWWPCTGPNPAVRTEFKLKWFPEHRLELRQTWSCAKAGQEAYPMRATGEAPYQIITGNIDCQFDSDSARTHCGWTGTWTGGAPVFTATQVRVLPPPPRNCTAASTANPDFKVSGFEWWSGYTIGGPFFQREYQNVTFTLANDALAGYSPRMVCSAESMFQPPGGVYVPPYLCKIFEANPEDAPETRFDWSRDGTRLTVQQSWWCEDASAPGGKKTFTSRGSVNVGPALTCRDVVVPHPAPWPADNAKDCVANSVISVDGKLL